MFDKLADFIVRKTEVVKFNVKAHSPEILIGVGIAGMVTSTVLACRATLKADAILKERKETLKTFEECKDAEDLPEYTEEDLKNDTKVLNIQTGVKIAGLYAPAVVAGVLSAGCLLKSNGIHREREASWAAAYASLDQVFKKYRERNVKEHGEEADAKFRHNTRQETVVNEKGEEEQVTVIDDIDDGDYSMLFDEASPYWEKNRHYNETFLLNAQATWNKTLRERALINIYGVGFVKLTEIYSDLGISLTPKKMKMWKDIGWVIDVNDPYYNPNANPIDFGIGNMIYRPRKPGTANCPDITPGYDPVFVVTPNPMGNIYTMFA